VVLFLLLPAKVENLAQKKAMKIGVGDIDDLELEIRMHIQMDGFDDSVFTIHGSKIGKRKTKPAAAGRGLHRDTLQHPGGHGESGGEGPREVLRLHPRRAVVQVLRVAVRVVRLPVRGCRRRAAGGAEQDPFLLPQDAPPQRPQPGARRRARLAVVSDGGRREGAVGLVVSTGSGRGVDVVVVVAVALEVEAGADESPAGEGGFTGAGGLALEARAVAAAAVHDEELETRGGCGCAGKWACGRCSRRLSCL
jgi:hypothetical protein